VTLRLESLEARELLNAHPLGDVSAIKPPRRAIEVAQHHQDHPAHHHHRGDRAPSVTIVPSHPAGIGRGLREGRLVATPALEPNSPGEPGAGHRPIPAYPTSTSSPTGTKPTQIRHAYGFDSVASFTDPGGTSHPADGTGQTITIVDAYDDPNIQAELDYFDTYWKLPATTVKKVTPQGTPTYDSGWASEIALDVEWAHAIAPGATIYLVEAKSNALGDLFGAVDYATGTVGAKVVSMSWGGNDFSLESFYDSHFNKPGVSFVASSGDTGGVVLYPSASPYVISAGGTTLQMSPDGTRLSESAWSSGGGGASRYEARPGYQAPFFSGRKRGTPDVAYDSDPATGFPVYQIAPGAVSGSWTQYGGTSAAAPQWTALIAIANQGRYLAGRPTLGTSSVTNTALYQEAGGSAGYTNPDNDYFDITAGSNGHAATVGYDLATGLGSPDAGRLIPRLVTI
jgi:subtilase family serine protease